MKTTANEIKLNFDDFLITKTDNKGNITYANRHFMSVSQYPFTKLSGSPQSIVRHPDMPKGIFKLLWNTIEQKHEFFGFIKNLSANGDFYWVFENITVDNDIHGKQHGYHSIRRKAPEGAIKTLTPIYQEMHAIEKQNSATGASQSMAFFEEWVASQRMSYRNLMLKIYKTG